MSIAQYQLSWDSYKSNVCNGFTNLQQNEEFVDMTLAADGHFVKVHKSILALASPYIKSMLQSTPTKYPILFLGSVTHEVLNYILTYVYTGEVSVEVDKIQSFMKVAKDLRLSGLCSMPNPKVGLKENKENLHKDLLGQRESLATPDTEYPFEEKVTDNAIFIKNVNAAEPTLTNFELLDTTVSDKQLNESNVNNVGMTCMLSNDMNTQKEPDVLANEDNVLNNRDNGLYVTADGYQYKLEIQQPYNKHSDSTAITVEDTSNKPSELMQVSSTYNTAVTSINDKDEQFGSFEDEFKKKMDTSTLHLESLTPEAITPQYTTSNRGSLQLILNRYMYYCHHQSHGGRKRRWRCIEYRSKHCPALIDTDGDILTSRKFGHPHTFHDDKIRKKMKRDLIFTNLNTLLEMQNKKKVNQVQI